MAEPTGQEMFFTGIAGSPGVIHGPVFSFHHGEVEVPHYSVPPERREEEIARFEQGLMETRRQISAIRAQVEEKVGEEEAAIFDAHQLVLEDRALIEDTVNEVLETGYNIEYCFQEVANRYIEAFNQIDDDYIKERVSDIKDVTKRVVYNLLGHDHRTHSTTGIGQHILVSTHLSPSETALLDVSEVTGIITEQGSRTSHSVIMARSLGIPCVVGVHGVLAAAEFGADILIDGYKGHVYLNPGRETLERYGRLATEQRHIQEQFEAERLLPSETLDKNPYPVRLNVEGVENKELMRHSGAMGVGLFRTENLFLSATVFPGEEEQFKVYKELVEGMGGQSVTIRTIDLGGDKNPHKSLTGYQEANPFMGFRGIRFCLEHTDVFKDQLRAILRASHYGEVKILYPMISSYEEVIRSNELLEEAKKELDEQGVPYDKNVQKGVMIEVPSAAVITDILAAQCDFFSIGTNDLMQYLLAVDRINDRIAHLYEPTQLAVIRTLNFIFQQGKVGQVPVSVCGELAGDPVFAPLLIGLGASDLSVSLGSLAQIKYLVRRIKLNEAKRLAIRVLRCNTSEEIKKELQEFYDQIMGETLKGLKDI
jgi:phosphotransferase system enzyme I (PtsI)